MSLDADLIEADHTPTAIAARLRAETRHNYLGDFVLGAVDGAVTTYAIVAGVAGADLSNKVALILGGANVLADGFSMAVGNYLSTQADRHLVERIRRTEERHIDAFPEGEREEVRQIFSAKGFEGKVLEQVVDVITRNRQRWIDTMVTEEFGLPLETPSPWRAALVTFVAFVVAGLVPLGPFCFPVQLSGSGMFAISSIATAGTFLLIGMAKGHVVHRSLIRSGLETLAIGGAAAALAYGVAVTLKQLGPG